MWTTALFVIVVLVAALLVAAALRPNDFAVRLAAPRSAQLPTGSIRCWRTFANGRRGRRGKSSTPR